MSSLYRVTDTAPPHVNGTRVRPGDLLTLSEAEARYERDLGHVEPTTVEAEARPLALTDAERAALPPLDADAGEAILAEPQWSEGTGEPMTAIPAGPDGMGGFAGHLHAE